MMSLRITTQGHPKTKGEKMKKLVTMIVTALVVIGCCLSSGCTQSNYESTESISSETIIEPEIVTADFLSFDTVDNFKTGAWAEFGDSGANASLSIHEGWVGLGEVRRTGTFLKFKLGTVEKTDCRAAFSSTAA